MIEPTVGRIVWFYPNQNEDRGFRIRDDQPCTASVVFVHNSRKINAVVTTHEGIPVFLRDVQLLQDDDPIPGRLERYCRWMPYQVGQAKKHEADPDEKLLGKDNAKH